MRQEEAWRLSSDLSPRKISAARPVERPTDSSNPSETFMEGVTTLTLSKRGTFREFVVMT